MGLRIKFGVCSAQGLQRPRHDPDRAVAPTLRCWKVGHRQSLRFTGLDRDDPRP